MSDSSLLKKKLLTVAETGAFSNFEPALLQKYKNELTSYLAQSPSATSSELYTLIELQFYLCVLTNDDVAAENQLALILDKFESNRKSQRIKLLQSIYLEALGAQKECRDLLCQDTDELKLSKRLITLSRKERDSSDYISSLTYYLGIQPSDLATWAELGDEYFKIGHYEEAIFCYKEILLQEPVAYHFFYKIGLTSYYKYLQLVQSKSNKKEQLLELLIQSRNNYLRCIEIYAGHEKSWLGVQILCKLNFKEKVPELKEYLAENEKLLTLSEKKLSSLGVTKID